MVACMEPSYEYGLLYYPSNVGLAKILAQHTITIL
jgi:hypothetical protein